MRKVTLILAILIATYSHAGIIRFTAKKVVVPSAKVTAKAGKVVGKNALKGLIKTSKTTARIVY